MLVPEVRNRSGQNACFGKTVLMQPGIMHISAVRTKRDMCFRAAHSSEVRNHTIDLLPITHFSVVQTIKTRVV